MERQRLLITLGAAVLLGATIIVLRVSEDTTGTSTPKPPPVASTRVLDRFAGEGVVLPVAGNRPDPPNGLELEAGSRRLQLRWNGISPEFAAGYEVRWGREGNFNRTRLVSQPIAQLDGLDDTVEYSVEVRTVDMYGQRSEPLRGKGKPTTVAQQERWSFFDDFDRPGQPLGVNWQLADRGACAKAVVGSEYDTGRLLVGAPCPHNMAVLRPRAPFRLTAQPDSANGELGKIVIETDAPAMGGELYLDLVPGPVELVEANQGDLPPDQPGTAHEDPSLLPGAVRIRIKTAQDSTAVRIQVPPGTPRTPPTRYPGGASRPALIGLSQRWEVAFTPTGIQVRQDGRTVGAANVLPAWREANLLIGFTDRPIGPTTSSVDLVGFTGEQTSAPPFKAAPPLMVNSVGPTDAPPVVVEAGPALAGTAGGQLRMVLQPLNGTEIGALSAQLGTRSFPLRAAVPGTAFGTGQPFPAVVDLPADALVLNKEQNGITVWLRNSSGRGAVMVQHAALELLPPPGTPSTPAEIGGARVPERPAAVVGKAAVRLLDAAGQPPQPGPVAKGRVVLEVTLDGWAGQGVAGELAGLAGLELLLDSDRLAVLPTATDGPGIGGTWRIGINLSSTSNGPHLIVVRGLGTDWKTAVEQAFVSFLVTAA